MGPVPRIPLYSRLLLSESSANFDSSTADSSSLSLLYAQVRAEAQRLTGTWDEQSLESCRFSRLLAVYKDSDARYSTHHGSRSRWQAMNKCAGWRRQCR